MSEDELLPLGSTDKKNVLIEKLNQHLDSTFHTFAELGGGGRTVTRREDFVELLLFIKLWRTLFLQRYSLTHGVTKNI